MKCHKLLGPIFFLISIGGPLNLVVEVHADQDIPAGQKYTIGGLPVVARQDNSSEKIGTLAGNGMVAGSHFNTLVGFQAGQFIAGGDWNTCVGYRAGQNITTGYSNVFLGYGAGVNNTDGAGNFFLGQNAGEANVSGFSNVYLGFGSGRFNVGSFNMFLGGQTDGNPPTVDSSIAIGYRAKPVADHQMVIGGDDPAGYITEAFLGRGVTSITPVDFTLQATGGSGTNKDGADLILAGGKSTGSALGGDVVFKVCPTASSGSSQNSLIEVARVTKDDFEVEVLEIKGGSDLSEQFNVRNPTKETTMVQLLLEHGASH